MFEARTTAEALSEASAASLEPLLQSFQGPSYVLFGPGLNIKWVNRAFHRSWVIGGGRGDASRFIGSSVLDAITPLLSSFYDQFYREVSDTGRCALHRYACPSPSANRWFVQLLVPRPEGVVIVNELLFEQARPRWARPLLRDAAQCCHCRRVRGPDGDWSTNDAVIETAPGELPNALCEDCQEFYFRGTTSVDWLS